MKLYLNSIKLHIKKELQYKVSFTLSFISQFFIFFGYYVTILCMFDKFSNVKGFNVYDVLLTFSIVTFGCSFCEVFFRGIDKFDNLIIDGGFDRLLLKPRNIFLLIICEDVNFVKVSRLLQSLIILIIAIVNMNITWDIFKIITLFFMIISSIIIFLSVFILSAAYCFITVKGLEVRNILTDGCKHMAQYPIGIFKKGFVYFLTFILPFGFVNYYPLLYILGRETNKLLIISPLITILYLFFTILLFNRGIKKYSSAGC